MSDLIERHDEMPDDGMTDRHVRTVLDRAERRRRAQLIGVALGVAVVLAVTVPVVALSMRRGDVKRPEQQTAKYEPIPLTAEQPAPAPEDPAPIPAAEPTPAAAPTVPLTPAPAPTPPAPDPAPAPAPPAPEPAPAEPQRLRIDIGESGYEPFEVKARADAPIVLTVGKGEGCAAGFLIPALDIEKDNSAGPVTFSLGKVKAGTYTFTCGMAMIEGRLVVR